MRKTVPWYHFESVSPSIAAAGRRLLFQDQVRAAGLLTTNPPEQPPSDHPVVPVLAGGELWLLIVNTSSTHRDLRENRCVGLHSLPTSPGGEEFHLRGVAEEHFDADRKIDVRTATRGGHGALDCESLFRIRIHSALHTLWQHAGTAQSWPKYRKWLS